MLRLDIFKAMICFAVIQFCGVSARPELKIGTFERRAPAAALELRTNAARMAAGFPPMPPRHLHDPTRAQALPAQPSPVHYGGHIRVVRARDGKNIGWIKHSQDDSAGVSRFGTTYGPGNRMSVTFTTSSPSSTPFNIAISGYGSLPYLGFSGSNIGGSTKNSLTRTQATPPGSVALPVEYGMYPGKSGSESSIWFFDKVTKQLTARWVNSGGSPVDSHFWFVQGPASKAGLFLVGKTSGLGDGFEVKFYLD